MINKFLRKRFWIICMVCSSSLFSHQASSQAAIIALIFGEKVASENFNISMELGGAYTNISGLENTDGTQFGFNFGIAGNAKVNKNFFISPTVFFVARRSIPMSSFSLNTGDAQLDSRFNQVPGEINLRYIDVPIFFSYQTNNKKFRFGLAPQVSFLQGADAIYEGDEGDFTFDYESNLNNFDYGVVGDFAYILGKAHDGKGVHLHLRYYYGLTDVLTDAVSTGTNNLGFFSWHISLPFITDELAKKNLEEY